MANPRLRKLCVSYKTSLLAQPTELNMVEADDDKIRMNVVSDKNTVGINDILLLLIFLGQKCQYRARTVTDCTLVHLLHVCVSCVQFLTASLECSSVCERSTTKLMNWDLGPVSPTPVKSPVY